MFFFVLHNNQSTVNGELGALVHAQELVGKEIEQKQDNQYIHTTEAEHVILQTEVRQRNAPMTTDVQVMELVSKHKSNIFLSLIHI